MKIVAICERPRGSLRCAYRDRVLACERINFVGVRTEYGATARMVASVQTRYRAHEGLGCPIRYPGNATSTPAFSKVGTSTIHGSSANRPSAGKSVQGTRPACRLVVPSYLVAEVARLQA
jgi:hypothetical protein